MNEKVVKVLGWVATVTAMAMYFSYIPQITHNLNGDKGDWLQPIVAAINCSLWVTYGFIKKPRKDWPIIVAKSPGVLFGVFAFITAL